jgi:hypothetical protein
MSIDVQYRTGADAVGYGLAGRFSSSGGVSYYAVFASASGEILLLKVLNGEETVLVDWTPCAELRHDGPARLSLELVGPVIRARVNGELAAEASDGDIASGGYALLAGPGVAASFDNLEIRGVRTE